MSLRDTPTQAALDEMVDEIGNRAFVPHGSIDVTGLARTARYRANVSAGWEPVRWGNAREISEAIRDAWPHLRVRCEATAGVIDVEVLWPV
jgi:hypothetical protein